MAFGNSILSSAIASLLIQGAFALPPPHKRDDISPSLMNVQQLTQLALTKYLETINVGNGADVHFSTAWPPIDFAGEGAAKLTEGQINDLLYQKCDKIPSPVDNSTIFFSYQYINFITEVNKNLPTVNSSAMNGVVQAQSDTCDKVRALLAKAVPQYLGAVNLPEIPGGKAQGDPGLLQWASVHYEPYVQANDDCAHATNEVDKLRAQLYGDNQGLYSISDEIIDVYSTTTASSQPGNNMPTDGDAGSSPFNNTGANHYVPAYYVPLLNGTLQSWQDNLLDNAPPAFVYNYQYGHYDNSTSTTSGGGHLNFIWDDVSGSGSGSGLTTTTHASQVAQGFNLSFAGITTVEIERGIWFDGYTVASTLNNPPPGDNITALAIPAFKEYFGTADKPLLASRYNSQMVLGYRPTMSITATNKTEFSQLKDVSASAEVCILFFCGGGSGSSSSNHTTVDEKSNTITFHDSTNNVYILGFIMENFWDALN